MDICSVERIQRILDSPRRQKFLERVYTDAERQVCSSRYDMAGAYATRFAAKEALLKALGAPPGIRWKDNEVVLADGWPSLRLFGLARTEPAGIKTTAFSGAVAVS